MGRGCVTLFNAVHGELASGKVLTFSRQYSGEDVASFDALSGRVLPAPPTGTLPDLLVVAPLTKLGGDLNYLARKMVWQHHRTVEVGEKLTAELEIVSLKADEGFHRIVFDARIRSGQEDVVLSGTSKGMILSLPEAPDAPDESAVEAAVPSPAKARPPADPSLLGEVAPGAVLRREESVSAADIDRCADLTGDYGAHHAVGLTGRQMAQGLLTAATVPLLRGDGDFRLRSMSMVFLQPVFAGDTVESEVRIGEAKTETSDELNIAVNVRNSDGVEVLVSECSGSL